MTSIEKLAWDILVAAGFEVKTHKEKLDSDPANTIYFQYKVERPGEKPWLIDFALPTAKIGLEVDGEYWHGAAHHKANDAVRDDRLRKMGWKVLRIPDKMVDRQHIEFGLLNLIDV